VEYPGDHVVRDAVLDRLPDVVRRDLHAADGRLLLLRDLVPLRELDELRVLLEVVAVRGVRVLDPLLRVREADHPELGRLARPDRAPLRLELALAEVAARDPLLLGGHLAPILRHAELEPPRAVLVEVAGGLAGLRPRGEEEAPEEQAPAESRHLHLRAPV
jgi:hypothetical protein